MGKVQVEIFEFSLLINHAEGITVIFPEDGHVLMIDQGGQSAPVNHGTDMELRGPGGDELPPGRTSEIDYRKFVVDLRDAEDSSITVPPALLDPKAPVDRTRINGRLFLRGGTIIGKECSIPENRTVFQFKKGPFFVTDTAVFEIDVPDGETCQLWANGQQAHEIPDGSSIRIRNADGVGSPPKSFEALDEFVSLCKVVGHSAAPPTLTDDDLHPQGGETVCAIAQISA